MGDIRFEHAYEKVRDADDPLAAIRALDDADVVAALAAATADRDPYVSNVLATEAQNRLQRASAIARHIGEGVISMDADGRATFVNPAAERILGWSGADLVGKDVHDTVHRAHEPRRPASRGTCAILTRVLQDAETVDVEGDLFARADGSTFPVQFTSTPVQRDGEVTGAVVVFRDITGRTRAERRRAARLAVTEALTEVRRFEDVAPRVLHAVGESLDWEAGAVWRVTPRGDALECVHFWEAPGVDVPRLRRASEETLLRPGVDIAGEAWSKRKITFSEDVTRDEAGPRADIAGETGLVGAIAFPLVVGERVLGVIEFFTRHLEPPDEDLEEMFRTIGNQVGQFKERMRVTEARSRLAAVVEATDDIIGSADENGLITSWNRGAEQLLGMSEREAIGTSMWQFVSPDEIETAQEEFMRAIRGERLRTERTLVSRTGDRFPVSATVFPLRQDPYGPRGIGVIARDITGRREMENALRASEERFRALLEAAPDAMVIVNEDGVITFVNRQTERMFGYDAEEILGKTVEVLMPERFRNLHVVHRNEYVEDPHRRPMGAGLDLYGRKKDGTEFQVEISLSPTRTAEGTLVTAAIRDARERERAEAEGRHARRP